MPRAAPLLGAGLLEGWAVRDELTSQNLGAAPRWVLATTAGVLQLEKRRPVDVLAQVGLSVGGRRRGRWLPATGHAVQPGPSAPPAPLLLIAMHCLRSGHLQLLEQRDQAKLEVFFQSYGAPEAAAMCVLLATAGPPAVGAAVVAAAKAALDNPRLCGEPRLREPAEGGGAAGGGGAAPFGAPAGGAEDGLGAGACGGVWGRQWAAPGAGALLCLHGAGCACTSPPAQRHLTPPAPSPSPAPSPFRL